MALTDWLVPTQIAYFQGAWTNPTNALVQDGNVAQVSLLDVARVYPQVMPGPGGSSRPFPYPTSTLSDGTRAYVYSSPVSIELFNEHMNDDYNGVGVWVESDDSSDVATMECLFNVSSVPPGSMISTVYVRVRHRTQSNSYYLDSVEMQLEYTAPPQKKITQFDNGYDFRKLYTLSPTNLATYSNAINVAVPFSVTDTDLKSKANGGKVHLNPLVDIRFEDTSGNKLNHEIIEYNETTGKLLAWVGLNGISSTGGNEVYLYYGKDVVAATSETISSWTSSGITLGYGRGSKITAMRDSNAAAYTYNFGELFTYCNTLKDQYGNTLTLGDSSGENSGQESGSASYGYFMYFTSATASRFTMASGSRRANFVMVRYNGTQWQYDNNSTYVNFTPAATDVLVARIKWGGSSGFECFIPLPAGEEEPMMLWRWEHYRSVHHLEDIPDANASWKEHSDSGWYSVTADSGGSMNSADSVAGIVGKALDFDGTNDSLTIPNQSIMQITGDLTISIWVYPRTTGQRRNIIGKAYGGEYELTIETNNTLSFYWGRSGANSGTSGATNGYQGLSGSTALPTNAWTHIVVSRKVGTGGWLRMYVNGTLDASVTPLYTSAVASTIAVTIGTGRINGAAQWFNGMMDEIKIQPTAREPAWVTNEYQTQKNLATIWSAGQEFTNSKYRRFDGADWVYTDAYQVV